MPRCWKSHLTDAFRGYLLNSDLSLPDVKAWQVTNLTFILYFVLIMYYKYTGPQSQSQVKFLQMGVWGEKALT